MDGDQEKEIPVTLEAVRLEARRTRIGQLYREGMRMVEIAGSIGVSVATVSRSIKELRREWQVHRLNSWDDRLADLLGEILSVRSAAWREFQASLATSIEETETDTTAGSGEGDAVQKRQTKKKRGRGNPRYLEIIMTTLEREARLLGMDAPLAFAQVMNAGKEKAGSEKELLDQEVMRAVYAEFARRQGAKLAAEANGSGEAGASA